MDEIDAEAIDLSADPTKPSALLVLALILIPIATITIGSFAPYFTAGWQLYERISFLYR